MREQPPGLFWCTSRYPLNLLSWYSSHKPFYALSFPACSSRHIPSFIPERAQLYMAHTFQAFVINYIGIVRAGTLGAVTFFHKQPAKRNIIGIGVAVLALILIPCQEITANKF